MYHFWVRIDFFQGEVVRTCQNESFLRFCQGFFALFAEKIFGSAFTGQLTPSLKCGKSHPGDLLLRKLFFLLLLILKAFL